MAGEGGAASAPAPARVVNSRPVEGCGQPDQNLRPKRLGTVSNRTPSRPIRCPAGVEDIASVARAPCRRSTRRPGRRTAPCRRYRRRLWRHALPARPQGRRSGTAGGRKGPAGLLSWSLRSSEAGRKSSTSGGLMAGPSGAFGGTDSGRRGGWDARSAVHRRRVATAEPRPAGRSKSRIPPPGRSCTARRRRRRRTSIAPCSPPGGPSRAAGADHGAHRAAFLRAMADGIAARREELARL